MAEWINYRDRGPTRIETLGRIITLEVPDHWESGVADAEQRKYWVGDPAGRPTLFVQQDVFEAERPDKAGLLFVRRFLDVVEFLRDLPGRRHLAYTLDDRDDGEREVPDPIQGPLALVHGIDDFEEDGETMCAYRWYGVMFADPVTVLLQRFVLVVPEAEAHTDETRALCCLFQLAAMRMTAPLEARGNA